MSGQYSTESEGGSLQVTNEVNKCSDGKKGLGCLFALDSLPLVCVCVWKTISEVSIRNLRGILTLLAPRVASRPKTKLLNTFAHSHFLSISHYISFVSPSSKSYVMLTCLCIFLPFQPLLSLLKS